MQGFRQYLKETDPVKEAELQQAFEAYTVAEFKEVVVRILGKARYASGDDTLFTEIVRDYMSNLE